MSKKVKSADHYDYELDDRSRRAREDVPWTRCGVPGYHNGGRGTRKWGPYLLNLGADKDRLYSDDQLVEFASGPGGAGRVPAGMAEERCFAELWDYESNENGKSILYTLLEDRGVKLSDKEQEVAELVAATMMQWLGTNCGRCFVDRARNNGRALVEHLLPEVHRDLKLQAAVGIRSAEDAVAHINRMDKLKEKTKKKRRKRERASKK